MFAQTNIALLRAAELNLDLGKKAEARQALEEFHRAWPHSEDIPAFTERLRTAASSADAPN